jgi:hypothetical protein
LSRPRPRRALFLEAAKADVARLAEDDPRLAQLAIQAVRGLERREVEGRPLADMALTGDLTDCRKLYFGLGSPSSHRIVYRELGPSGDIEIIEGVAVEARDALYAYLLSAARLGRLPDESKPRFNRLHQQIVQRRASRQRR